MTDRCPVCAYPLIAGVAHCVQCGEPTVPIDALIVVRGVELGEATDPPAWAQAYARTMTEGRALEAVGDSTHAIVLYERLVSVGCAYPAPFKRLAVLYRRAKRLSDEERILRLALARLSDRTNGWFVVRLARRLGRRGVSCTSEYHSERKNST